MKFFKENLNNNDKNFIEIPNPQDSDYYFKNRIISKFDKWLGYDCGSIRYDVSEDKDYYYEGIWEESWVFVGRQEDKRYYFLCTQASYSNREMIGKVISFKTFRDATYMIAFPGRGY